MNRLFFDLILIFSLFIVSATAEEVLFQNSTRPKKCGTLDRYLLQKQGSGGAGKIRSRPVLQRSYELPNGHFKIWYNTQGQDAVNSADQNVNEVPDYIDSCAQIMEYVWLEEIDHLKFKAPPSDSVFAPSAESDNSRYDLYIKNLENESNPQLSYYGLTWRINAGPGPNRYCSYIELDNDYAGALADTASIGFTNYAVYPLEALRVTAAHEFFHAIQFGINGSKLDTDPIYENTATCMEEIVFDRINDYYQYINGGFGFFNSQEVSLNTVNQDFEYGSSMWPIYLSERFGSDIIVELWNQIDSQGLQWSSSYFSYESVLAVQKTDWHEQYGEFVVWNYFIGEVYADPDQFYAEGDQYYGQGSPYYQSVTFKGAISNEDTLKGILNKEVGDTSFSLNPVSCKYYKILVNQNKVGGLRFNFGKNFRYFRLMGINLNSGSKYVMDPADSLFILNHWTNYTEISVVCYQFNKDQQLSGQWSVRFDSTATESVIVWPGDTDNDSAVTVKDILPLGLFWKQTFAIGQSSVNSGWKPVAVPAWPIKIMTYADANVDGKIDSLDFEIIRDHLGLSQGNGTSGKIPLRQRIINTQHLLSYLNGAPDSPLNQILIRQGERFLEANAVVGDRMEIALSQNLPNPFHKNTLINLKISQAETEAFYFAGPASLRVFDLNGNTIKNVQIFDKGWHDLPQTINFFWDGRNDRNEGTVPAGIYFYHFTIGKRIFSKRMLLIK